MVAAASSLGGAAVAVVAEVAVWCREVAATVRHHSFDGVDKYQASEAAVCTFQTPSRCRLLAFRHSARLSDPRSKGDCGSDHGQFIKISVSKLVEDTGRQSTRMRGKARFAGGVGREGSKPTRPFLARCRCNSSWRSSLAKKAYFKVGSIVGGALASSSTSGGRAQKASTHSRLSLRSFKISSGCFLLASMTSSMARLSNRGCSIGIR
jgi:hypothetical protein